jgi:hypothetical protein
VLTLQATTGITAVVFPLPGSLGSSGVLFCLVQFQLLLGSVPGSSFCLVDSESFGRRKEAAPFSLFPIPTASIHKPTSLTNPSPNPSPTKPQGQALPPSKILPNPSSRSPKSGPKTSFPAKQLQVPLSPEKDPPGPHSIASTPSSSFAILPFCRFLFAFWSFAVLRIWDFAVFRVFAFRNSF